MYVQRDASGAITGGFANPQPGFATELVADNDKELQAFLNPPKQFTVLPQDLMVQFTAADAALLRTAINGNAQMWLLWSAMQAQKEPMRITNARFIAGWSALVGILGQPRMNEIAVALGIPSLVV